MSAMGSRILLLFVVLITSSLYVNWGSLASPINEQLDNVAFRPRELGEVLERINKAPLSRREDDDLLPTATDTKCKNTPPNGGQWESEKVEYVPTFDQNQQTVTDVMILFSFPTVVSLKADMKTCGNIGPNTVFYSWGIGAVKATAFAQTLSPKGMTFNDALDASFIAKMQKFNFGAPSSPRFILFVQRWEEAMASLLYGTVYLVVPTGYGAYTPPGTARNDWYNVEFPTVSCTIPYCPYRTSGKTINHFQTGTTQRIGSICESRHWR